MYEIIASIKRQRRRPSTIKKKLLTIKRQRHGAISPFLPPIHISSHRFINLSYSIEALINASQIFTCPAKRHRGRIERTGESRSTLYLLSLVRANPTIDRYRRRRSVIQSGEKHSASCESPALVRARLVCTHESGKKNGKTWE